MQCPYCGADNRPGGRFCNYCGRLLTVDQSTTQQAQDASQSPRTSSSLKPGDRLQNDRYVIKKILGEGGMGAALLAEDTRLDNKPVVIKELISENSNAVQLQEDVRNFKREVSTLAQVDHFLVPGVTDHFQEGSHYFMVQEYVAGENLEERLERLGRPLPEVDVLTYASDILLVLDYLARRKPPIVHRDVKPANIIISSNDGRAHLVDFGIARPDIAPDAVRKQTSALGTPGYAPPEQYQGKADPRSDLYALAATMHHLLTNRDPREHPPFVYPPARSLNPQLSPEVEQVLLRALNNNSEQRYQSAAEMKEAIDEILAERFGVLGATLTTGAHPVTPTHLRGSSVTASTPPPPPGGVSTPPPPPARPSTPPPPGGLSASYQPAPQQQRLQRIYPRAPRSQSNVLISFVLLLLVLILIGSVALGLFSGLVRHTGSTSSNDYGTSATQAAPTLPASINGIGALSVASSSGSSERIGLSDGSVIFDVGRPSGDGSLKESAAARFMSKDYAGAQSYLAQAISLDSSDAEALIYQEDLRVLSSGSPYVTLVVGTMLSGPDIDVGREILQGAYVAQHEFNSSSQPGGVKLRLLIASSGSQSTYATTVAQQVTRAAQQDSTIIGVMGWPFSSQTINAIGPLAQAHLPIVSATASSDQLTGASPYFFRVAPSNVSQGIAGAQYALQTLHTRRVALFYDPGDAYSSSLYRDFRTPFVQGGGQVVAEEQFQTGHSDQLASLVQQALQKQPDLIYFAGYASDVTALLHSLPTSGPFANLPLLGGDALYQPQGYGNAPGFTRLHFTSFAYPDEWGYLQHPQPAFFSDYSSIYSGNGQHSGYGYTRADYNTLLAYDATQVLLEGCRRVLTAGKQTVSGPDLQQALTTITGSRAFQGVSGQISFGSNGDPQNKAIVVLYVDSQGHIKIASIQGKFFG